ncbi:aromatic motif membrane protein [Mycoplasma sp. AC1221]
MKVKKIFLNSLFLVPLISVSCSDYSQGEKLSSLISNEEDISSNPNNIRQKKTDALINDILNDLFKGSEVKKLEFINKQKQSKDEIEKTFITMSQEYNKLLQKYKEQLSNIEDEIDDIETDLKELKFTPKINSKQIIEKEAQLASKIKQLSDIRVHFRDFAIRQNEKFSQNWYYFFTNIDKFNFEFIEYVYDGLQNGKTASSEYKKSIDSKISYPPFRFNDNYLDNKIQGIESVEFRNSVIYYISKGKMVFRILIENLDTENPKLSMKAMNWYFGSSKANTISLPLVSSVVHTLFIHQYPNAYPEFEDVMVKKQKYGEPAFMFGVWKNEKMS